MTISLDQALRIGNDAVQYARAQIHKSASWLELNKKPIKNMYILEDQIKNLRSLVDEADPLIPDDDILLEFENRTKFSSKFSIGNCHEFAFQALYYILNHVDPAINAELYYIEGGDHLVLVLNRKPDSVYWNPLSWGSDAIICDPWANKVFMAANYLAELNNFFRFRHKNHLESFNHFKHVLLPYVNYNTAYLRAKRNPQDLWKHYSNETRNLLSVLKTYKDNLGVEIARLEKKYGRDNEKSKALIEKARELDPILDSIKDTYSNETSKYSEEDNDYQLVKLKLGKRMQENRLAAIKAMQFSKSSLSTLFAYKDQNKKDTYYQIKYSLMRFFRIKSTTEENLRKITKGVNKFLTK